MFFERRIKKMKIALIWPKSTFLENPMVFPPLGLWYVWTILEEMGQVSYIDTSVDDYQEIPESDYYFVSGTSSQLLEIRRILKWVKANRDGITVLGGPHALTHESDHLCSLGFDLVYKGEVNSREDLEFLFNAPPDSRIITRPFSKNLDNLKRPCRKAATRYKAKLLDSNGKEHPTTTLFTSRGCPNKCAFCESGYGRMWGNRVRFNPVSLVIQEIEECYNLGFTGLMFYDDIFPLNKNRTLQILEVLEKYHKEIGAVWRCFLRSDILLMSGGGYDYLKKMRESGLAEILVGVESASNAVKNNVQKGTTIEQDTQMLKLCKEMGIKFKASIILGLPGETIETMEETREWIFRHRPDRVDIGTLIPFPGTPISTDMALKTGQYDIYLDTSTVDLSQGETKLPESFWYKGPRDKSICLVGTSSLTPQEIEKYRNKLIEEIIREKIPY
jgi:anaerobic magnesium-protoporphyrin IX monomethyl ester cyclase